MNNLSKFHTFSGVIAFEVLQRIPVLKEKTAQSPIHCFPETSSKYSMSEGDTFPESSALTSGWTGFSIQGQLPAPWQLNTPITPVHLFKFHILRRLHRKSMEVSFEWNVHNRHSFYIILRKMLLSSPCAAALVHMAWTPCIAADKSGVASKWEHVTWTMLQHKLWCISYLFPSITGSSNKQSRDGRPGYLALRTDPSASTSFLSTLKSWWPGLSLH